MVTNNKYVVETYMKLAGLQVREGSLFYHVYIVIVR